MLINLHVKNLALIKEADIDFKDGLNILSGETGAGKSIVIGSISLALGEKISKEIIRVGEESALVELVFLLKNQEIINKIKSYDIPVDEDNQVIVSRKIMKGHSLNKVNGITVNLSVLKEITAWLVDIHGQHDHQSLLDKKKHLELLDEFIADKINEDKSNYKNEYLRYQELIKNRLNFELDEEQRLREVSLLEYEIQEIEDSNLKEGEDEELEYEFKKLSSSQKIVEVLSSIHQGLEENNFGKHLKELSRVIEYDGELENLYNSLQDLESISGDMIRYVYDYIEANEHDSENLLEIEKDLII